MGTLLYFERGKREGQERNLIDEFLGTEIYYLGTEIYYLATQIYYLWALEDYTYFSNFN